MSKKSTKIIAVAGVVAGLGVAALPALTFAVSTDGAVKLDVEVTPSIAMTIHSNGDASGTTYFSESVDNAGANYGITGATEFVKDTETQLFSNPSSAKTSLLPNATSETMNSVVRVYTNNASGYALSVSDQDSNNSLVNGQEAIAAISDGATLEAGTAAWGIKGGDLTAYKAVPVSTGSLTLLANGSLVAGGEETTFTYGVATSTTQKTGTYTDTIVYTATTK